MSHCNSQWYFVRAMCHNSYQLTKELLWGMGKPGVREVGWGSMSQVRSRGQDVVDGEERGTATGRCKHAVVIGFQLLRWVVVRKMMHFQDYTRRKKLNPGRRSSLTVWRLGILIRRTTTNPQGNHTTRSIFSVKSSEIWKYRLSSFTLTWSSLFISRNLKI